MDITLRTIIYDLLSIIRNARINDDEPISERQIEAWIHQYRAMLIKRDLDKNKIPNPDYIQDIDRISLELDTNKNLYRTSVDIPKAINFNHKSGLTFVGDRYGNQIQLIPQKRTQWQGNTKWTQDATLAFLNNSRIYLYNGKGLSEVSVRGIFQNPVDAVETNGGTFTYDTEYPIPSSMLPTLKEEILKKELNIIYKAPYDDENDANHKLTN